MITDLFSHKIHSSKPEWADKLIELACIFQEFDGHIYDRKAIEERLNTISPRGTFVARDPSKFRDEISAYPAYLGLYRLELQNNKWHFLLSKTAKKFLTSEEPNVNAFMLLQLLLFQYPNGMGVAYYSNSDKFRIQANIRDRTLNIINNNIQISPLRLICKALEADAIMKDVSIFEANINANELFILANHSSTNNKILPITSDIISVLTKARNGTLFPPPHFENRSHILNHTDIIQSKRGKLSLRPHVNEPDKQDILKKFHTICNLSIGFDGFKQVKSEKELEKIILNGTWGRYFDSLYTLSANLIETLSNDPVIYPSDSLIKDKEKTAPKTYPLKKRGVNISPPKKIKKIKQFADPEITKIKRQRSNLSHKLILQQLDEYLRNKGIEPYENEHIDLYAKVPDDGKFLFEVKSIFEDNLLGQTRKGISQLYEYRFRYKAEIGYNDVTLCLVYPHEPRTIEWLQEYICIDREIAVIWFSENGELCTSNHCKKQISPLFHT